MEYRRNSQNSRFRQSAHGTSFGLREGSAEEGIGGRKSGLTDNRDSDLPAVAAELWGISSQKQNWWVAVQESGGTGGIRTLGKVSPTHP